MIWDHIKVQVETNIQESPYQFIEFQEALARDDWHQREPFDRWVWGFGYSKPERVELTFTQIVSFWRCEGYRESHIEERLEYLRYQIAAKVDELIRIEAEEDQQDLMQEHNKIIEEEAAA